jgi:hypothetical protein
MHRPFDGHTCCGSVPNLLLVSLFPVGLRRTWFAPKLFALPLSTPSFQPAAISLRNSESPVKSTSLDPQLIPHISWASPGELYLSTRYQPVSTHVVHSFVPCPTDIPITTSRLTTSRKPTSRLTTSHLTTSRYLTSREPTSRSTTSRST